MNTRDAQVDDISVEKCKGGFHDDVMEPGSLAKEYQNKGWNNQWDDSFPIDRYSRKTSGNRGGDLDGDMDADDYE